VSLAILGGPPVESDLGTGNVVWVEERDPGSSSRTMAAPRALVVLLHRARTRLGNRWKSGIRLRATAGSAVLPTNPRSPGGTPADQLKLTLPSPGS